jgi:phosphosulfolactate synthase (CoM biosynthesis protein A)
MLSFTNYTRFRSYTQDNMSLITRRFPMDFVAVTAPAATDHFQLTVKLNNAINIYNAHHEDVLAILRYEILVYHIDTPAFRRFYL